MSSASEKQAVHVAIVGATGLVGRELLSLLVQRRWPVSALSLFASTHGEIQVSGHQHTVERLDLNRLEGADVVFLASTGDVARAVAPASRPGQIVIDNSSAFRMDAGVPLVVPEVNAGDIGRAELIANPNCTTILLLTVLAPLHRAFSCSHVNVSTYQAVSGAGRDALQSLRAESSALLSNAAYSPDLARAFNCWSHESVVDEITGSNAEEDKVIRESAKILGEDLPLSVTCIRVPVERAHGESVWMEFEQPVREADVRAVLSSAPGVQIVDDRQRGYFPTSRSASFKDVVQVGRIRPDRTGVTSGGRSTRFQLWLTGDQLRKGAALNAVQIAEAHPALSISPPTAGQATETPPALSAVL